MIHSVLVVCVGNICRSPVGERLLAKALPDHRVSSAGLAALEGHAADAAAAKAAAEIGLRLQGHVARQFTEEIGKTHDLILVMEPGHRDELILRFPQFSGRTMLFDHWNGGKGIHDPYKQPIEVHRATRDRIVEAASAWTDRLLSGERR